MSSIAKERVQATVDYAECNAGCNVHVHACTDGLTKDVYFKSTAKWPIVML